jgi:transcription elongation factor Elf1
MVNQLLVTLVNSVLGQGKPTARNNYAYHCPFCHHSKPKLEVNLTENKEGKNPWHCWTCDTRGSSIYSLFKKIKVSKDKIDKLKSLVKSSKTYVSQTNTEDVKLPEEFKPLSGNISTSDIMARHALAFLKKRNITEDDIVKHNIGYCESGKYRNRIIIPTYDKDGSLNFFTARSFDDSSLKYLNPPLSRDIIANEHLINWNLPIILCEGLFDALSIKRNVIPLLGKNIQSSLMKKLVTSKVDKIYIALDKDAIKQALRFCEVLLAEGKEVYLVDLQEKDPNEMGFKNFTKLIQSTFPLTYSSLLEKKLNLC